MASAILAGCTTLPAAGSILPAGAHYVAMGSSFAAGANIPPRATDRPARCGASDVSYSRLLARRLNLALTDVSCGGATTAHLLDVWDELPAQLDAITPDTRLVTVTVGGNDLNYMGVMFAASCHAGVIDPRSLSPETGQCRPLPLPDEAAYAALERGMISLFAQIRARAPRARVVLVQYVALADDPPCAAAPLLPEHAAQARLLARRLATISARAARAHGAEVLPIDELSQGHTPCSAQPWSRGLAPDYDGAQGGPWHPTAEGHAAIARELERLLARQDQPVSRSL